MTWSGSHYQHFRWSKIKWWRWLWLFITSPGFKFHCAHSSYPELELHDGFFKGVPRKESDPKVSYCKDCGMLYKTRFDLGGDRTYLPTNRRIPGWR